MKWSILCYLLATAVAAPPQRTLDSQVSQDLVSVVPHESNSQARQQRASEAPVTSPTGGVQILKYDNDNNGTGDYKFEFIQSDGTKFASQGELRNKGRDDEFIAVRGAFEWVAADGETYSVTYVADENGYQPTYIQKGFTLNRNGVPAYVLIRLLAK